MVVVVAVVVAVVIAVVVAVVVAVRNHIFKGLTGKPWLSLARQFVCRRVPSVVLQGRGQRHRLLLLCSLWTEIDNLVLDVCELFYCFL